MTIIEVTWAGERRVLQPAEALTFGRDRECDLCLDPDDRGISRRAGLVEDASVTWHLHNTSARRPLQLVDATRFPRSLLPGTAHAVGPGKLEVVVAGKVRRHCVVITTPPAPPASPPVASGAETDLGTVRFLDDDRRAMVALFAGYLYDFPRYDPHPATYREAAARLGWRVAALRRRVDRIYARLDEAGVPGVHGPHALEHLAQYVLTTGVITQADLGLLGPD